MQALKRSVKLPTLKPISFAAFNPFRKSQVEPQDEDNEDDVTPIRGQKLQFHDLEEDIDSNALAREMEEELEKEKNKGYLGRLLACFSACRCGNPCGKRKPKEELDMDEDAKRLAAFRAARGQKEGVIAGNFGKGNLEQLLLKNYLFADLTTGQRLAVLRGFVQMTKAPGEPIITEGETGDYFFVLEAGEADVMKKDDQDGHLFAIFTMKPGTSFGEAALLYDVLRSNTVVARTECKLWALDRATFRKYALEAVREKREQWEGLLSAVPLFHGMNAAERAYIADSLSREVFPKGDNIVTQGDKGDKFYIVEEGECVAEVYIAALGATKRVARYGRGGFFGEMALLRSQPRAATVKAMIKTTCAWMDNRSFSQMVTNSPVLREKLLEVEAKYRKMTGDDEESKPKTLEAMGLDRRTLHATAEHQLPGLVGGPPVGQGRCARLVHALSGSIAFKGVSQRELYLAVEGMNEVLLTSGQILCDVGEEGHHMFVVEAGELDVFAKFFDNDDDDEGYLAAVSRFSSGQCVGELAVMYGTKRNARLAACARGARVWALPTSVYEAIAGSAMRHKRILVQEFLVHVLLFQKLSEVDLTKIADSVTFRTYEMGEFIIRQGEPGREFFIVEKGACMCTCLLEDNGEEVELCRYSRGSYFGEVALMNNVPRAATIKTLFKTRVGVIEKVNFLRLVGQIQKLREELEGAMKSYL